VGSWKRKTADWEKRNLQLHTRGFRKSRLERTRLHRFFLKVGKRSHDRRKDHCPKKRGERIKAAGEKLKKVTGAKTKAVDKSWVPVK